MRLLNRVVVVACVWGALEAIVIVLPLYFFGVSPLAGSSEQFLSYGLVALSIAFFSGYLLADVRDGVKALVLAEIIAFVAAAAIMAAIRPAALLPQEWTFVYLAILAVPHLFLFFGLIGGVVGAFFGTLMDEDPGMFTLSLRKHRVVLLVMIVIMVIAVSAFAVQTLITNDVNSALNGYLLKGPFIVADQNVYMNANVRTLGANFSSIIHFPGEFRVSWTSSQNVSFHVVMSRNSRDVLIILSSANYGGPGVFGASSTAPYNGPPFVSYDLTTNAEIDYFMAWFQNEACTGSSCISTWINYTIAVSHY